jgi:toxin ParE1/3/4
MIEWTGQATRQLDQAHDYIALSNREEVAARITMQIVTSVQQLATFPMSGRSGRVPVLVSWSFRIRPLSQPTPSIKTAS